MAREVPLGRKVAIYGPSGSGKSTLAIQLGVKLGLPVVDLDHIYHPGPTWDQDLQPEEFRRQVTEALASHPDGWVIAGNYSAVRDLVLAEAQTAIWLDLPFPLVYRRLAWRTLSRAVTGEEIFNGLKESLFQTFFTRYSMLWWGLSAWRPARQKIRAWLTEPGLGAKVYVLKTQGQVRYLETHATLRPAES